MKKQFWLLMGRSFLKVQGIVIGTLSLLLGVLLWYFSEVQSLIVFWFIIWSIVSVILVSVLVSVIIELIKSQKILPKILKVKKVQDECICLLESSELFSNGIGVSFYYTDENEFEQLICIGIVNNIQENKLIQVNIHSYQEHHKELIGRLENNDRQLLDNIILKPSIPVDIKF